MLGRSGYLSSFQRINLRFFFFFVFFFSLPFAVDFVSSVYGHATSLFLILSLNVR